MTRFQIIVRYIFRTIDFVIISTMNFSFTLRFVLTVFTKLHIGCAKLILCVMSPLLEGSGDTVILKKEKNPIFFYIVFITGRTDYLTTSVQVNLKSQ